MSSTLSRFADNIRLPHPFPIVTMVYGPNNEFMVPFTYNKTNRVLDFDFSGTFNADTTINRTTTAYVYGTSFNDIHAVSDIGPNIVAWCETEVGADVGTVRIVEKPIVVRTNHIAVGREPNNDCAMQESNTPFDFESSSGSPANNYGATYLFRKPLVVTYTIEGVVKYRMFNTQFSGQT